MNRMFLLTGVLALGVVVTSNVVKADDKDDDKIPSIDKIMQSAHGEGGLRNKITVALKEKAWDDVQSGAKDWVKQAVALSKNKPSKGTEASWKKLSGAYEKNVKALAAATEKKDADGAKAALKSLNVSCGGCHGPHKPKKSE